MNYLRQQQQQKRQKKSDYTVMVVRYRNVNGIYNTPLYGAFKNAVAGGGLQLTPGDLEYTTGKDGISYAFSSVVGKIYAKNPDAVYFAGRGADLRGLITAMCTRRAVPRDGADRG
ncbi:MAG: ABC-type branched-chain amino acid transport system, substrate-binding protein [Streptomyces oryziradicis]|nr:ABC-type branched-chain amino acid transport system, substrate-binding protein [Actinacidiphila oryziradicis]